MARDSAFRDYILYDLLHDVPGLTARGMFGGFAFYKDGIVFGLLIGDVLYFKVGENNKGDFERYASTPFSFEKKNGTVTLTSYWQVPAEIMDDHELLLQWMDKALIASIKNKSSKEGV